MTTRRGANLLAVLSARAAAVGAHAARRRPRRGRVAPQKQPDAIRRTYYETLQPFVDAAAERVRRNLYPRGPEFAVEAARLHGDSLRLDAPAAAASKIFADLSRDFFAEFTPERLAAVVRHFGVEISDFQKREIARQFKAVIGIDPFQLGEPWLNSRIETFVAENVSLIRTVPERMFADIEQTFMGELRAGTRWEDISAILEDRFGIADTNAERIARDQVGKFFGELNRARQQDVGVVDYIWRTARDNRVRDTHEVLEGEVFEWGGEGAPGVGHPGEDINCRCQGEPNLGPLIEALDE